MNRAEQRKPIESTSGEAPPLSSCERMLEETMRQAETLEVLLFVVCLAFCESIAQMYGKSCEKDPEVIKEALKVMDFAEKHCNTKENRMLYMAAKEARMLGTDSLQKLYEEESK